MYLIFWKILSIFEIICEQGPLLRLSKSMSKNCFANYSHPPWYKLCISAPMWTQNSLTLSWTRCLKIRFEGMWTWTCNSIRWYQIRTLSVVQWASVRVTISFSIWIKDRSSIQKNVHQNFWMCIHPMCILSDSCWPCSVKVMKNRDSWFMINLIWNSVGKPLSAGYVCCN